MSASRTLAFLCLLALPLHAQSQAPDFPKAFAGHAQFETTAGFRRHGWAILVAARPSSQPYVLSVRRLLGPEGGFPRQVSAAEAPAFVRSIEIDSLSGGTHSYIVEGIPMPSASNDTMQDPASDLSVYRLHNGPPADRDIILAAHVPAAGEIVWLMTKAGQGVVLKGATVVSKQRDPWLGVQLNAGTLEDDAAGAPVLNSAGELVGLYSHRDPRNPATLDLIPANVILHVLPAT